MIQTRISHIEINTKLAIALSERIYIIYIFNLLICKTLWKSIERNFSSFMDISNLMCCGLVWVDLSRRSILLGAKIEKKEVKIKTNNSNVHQIHLPSYD